MEDRITKFLQAVGEKNLLLVKHLLDAGQSPSEPSDCGNTPLCNAVQARSIEMIGLLLEYGADINERITYVSPVDGRVKKEYTPLMYASDEEVVRYLCGRGAEINYQAPNGLSLLMLCASVASAEYVGLVKLLISLGACKELVAESYKGTRGKFTALAIAEEEERFLRALNKKYHSEKLDAAIEYITEMQRILR